MRSDGARRPKRPLRLTEVLLRFQARRHGGCLPLESLQVRPAQAEPADCKESCLPHAAGPYREAEGQPLQSPGRCSFWENWSANQSMQDGIGTRAPPYLAARAPAVALQLDLDRVAD